ncbi:uncharacterized protein LOC123681809 [Harmonia axyridis]|uniref:uncharacterized protein LOC123681809 n=1 Tax=Harmonia axyridis TaxID=115357 RepID=UPI001E279AC2|nr:uncharacterized protein LOC123681809 [Harmonia axyridis]
MGLLDDLVERVFKKKEKKDENKVQIMRREDTYYNEEMVEGVFEDFVVIEPPPKYTRNIFEELERIRVVSIGYHKMVELQETHEDTNLRKKILTRNTHSYATSFKDLNKVRQSFTKRTQRPSLPNIRSPLPVDKELNISSLGNNKINIRRPTANQKINLPAQESSKTLKEEPSEKRDLESHTGIV